MRSRLAAAALAAVAALACTGAERPVDPRPAAVEPSAGDALHAVRVTIRGEGFLPRATGRQSDGAFDVELRHRAWLDDAELLDVAWVDTRTLLATVPAGLPAGPKALVVENAFGRRGGLERAYTVSQAPLATLEATLAVVPAALDVGQAAAVTLTVRNTGGAAARDVVPGALALDGEAAQGARVGAPAPAARARLEPGDAAAFAWEVTPIAAGALSLRAQARAVDDPSSTEVAASLALASAAVQTPAALAATVTAGSGAPVQVGVPFSATVTVSDGGGAGATVTRVDPLVTPAAAATCDAVTPAPPRELPGGGRATFTLSCTARAAGAFTLGASVGGADANSGAALAASAPAVALDAQQPAEPVATVAASPAAVDVGQAVAVTFTVVNGGTSTVDVSAVAPSWSGSTATASCGSASPATASIPGRASRTFGWSCTATTPGALVLGGTATGTDALTGARVSAAATPISVPVTTPAALSAALAAEAHLAAGRPTTVSLTVSNGGGAGARVTAATLTPGGVGATCTAGTAPPADVPGGGSVTFTWSCTPAAAGTLELAGSAAGTDAHTGDRVSATATPLSRTVAATLEITDFSPAQSAVYTGHSVVITLTLRNRGATPLSITDVRPTMPGASPGCGGLYQTFPVAVNAAASATINWTCTASSAGLYALGATVSAADPASGASFALTAGPALLIVR